MRKVHTLSLLICLTGLGSGACYNLDGTGGQPPDADTIDADTTDADLSIMAEAEASISGNLSGTADFAWNAAGVTGTIELTLAPENPELRGVRIMTGTSCDAGSEGAVWEFGDLGDMTIEEVAPHTGGGELLVDRDDWTIGTGEASDIVGRLLVIFSDTGDTGTITSCSILTLK